MRIKLWGTRGSIPSPLRTEEIEAKIQSALVAAGEAGVDLNSPAAIRAFISNLPYAARGTAGGDTACLEVRSAGNLLIFDCGSGMRRLGVELMKEEFGRGQGVAHIFICHTHWDHMMGWPFFGPSYIRGNRFFIYGVHPDMEGRFRLQQTAPSMFPIDLDYPAGDVRFVTLQEGETLQLGQTRVSNMLFPHPGDSYGYRVEDQDGVFVYAGDSEYKTLDPASTRSHVAFFRDADALVFDAMFSLKEYYFFYENWGHSSAVAGADLATRAGARRLLLFHHAPASRDEQIWSLRDEAEEYLNQHPDRPPCEIIVAHDGFELELWRDAKLEARSEHLKDGAVVHLLGRLVGETAGSALSAIEDSASRSRHQALVVNLSQVDHVGRAGIKALLAARRRWRPLALAGLAPEVRRTLAQAGALDYFAHFDTPREALEALAQGLAVRPGQTLNGRYRLEKRLERGPLGDRYRATDRATGRQVAILIVCPSLGRLSTNGLLKAARSAAGLRHPSIADLLEAGSDGPITFLASEYSAGRSIRQLLNAAPASRGNAGGAAGGIPGNHTPGPLPALEAIRIGAEIANALEYAHRQNVVHGGLCPENVVLLDDGSIKLTNFGVSRLTVDKPLHELPAHMGGLDYLSPEQLQGYWTSPSSDLFALGAILYEMLTGEPPFAATDGNVELFRLQLLQPPVPPRRHNFNLSRSLEHLVLNLLHRSPRKRRFDAAAVSQTLSSLAPQIYQKPLLGRDKPVEKMRQHLERVAHGQSGMLVVHGSRGIGKSRLALSLANQRVGDQPLTTLYGELFACEDTRVYRLFVKALRCELLALPAHRLSQLLEELDGLARPLIALMPELRPALSTLTAAEADCEGLEEAICQTLHLMTKNGPVLLILDSLQWIDSASLRLLERLARQRIPRLLILALFRTEEVDGDHPLSQTLGALDAWIDEQLHLPPVGPIQVHQMASRLNASVPPDFGLWLYSETDGNPLHTEQLIQAYAEGPGETRHVRERSVATTLEEVILRRLERLPNSTLATLRQAAALGNSFQFDRLRAALDEPEQRVLANLDTALRAGLIVGHASEGGYNFGHPFVREVIYAEMLAGVRKRYHARAARVLESAGVSGWLDEKNDLLVYHFVRAGEHKKAAAYLSRAIRRANHLCADDSALHYVNQALDVIEQLIGTAADEREHKQWFKQRNDLLTARDKLQTSVKR